LHLCSEEGYLEGVRWLLQKGVDVNIQDAGGSTLYAASIHGHTEIVRLLLESGAEVDSKGTEAGEDGEMQTALQAACTEGHTDIVRLLASGAHANAQGTFLGTVI
ncbi:ankyrin repeat protein, partial [Mycena maculata]